MMDLAVITAVLTRDTVAKQFALRGSK